MNVVSPAARSDSAIEFATASTRPQQAESISSRLPTVRNSVAPASFANGSSSWPGINRYEMPTTVSQTPPAKKVRTIEPPISAAGKRAQAG